MNKDLVGGLVLLVLAGAYFQAAQAIPHSMLDDAFGSRGLPVILAGLLAFLAIILTLRGVVGLRASPGNADEDDDRKSDAPLPRALGFLLIGVGYIVVLPLVGYGVAIALLIAAVALYEGAARNWRIPVAAIFGGILFWLLFNKLLGVAQPSGTLFSPFFS